MAYESSLKRAGSVVANAVLCGTVSEIGGGKFANGAVTGAFAMMFNDMMHQGQKKIRDISKKDLVFTGKNKKLVRKEAYEFMIKRSKETGNEIAAAVLEDGNVIVFHDDNNDSHNSMMNVIAKDVLTILFIRVRNTEFLHMCIHILIIRPHQIIT